MSHNLNYNEKTGLHSFMSVKAIAWHRLGTILDNYPSSSEAIKAAGLDYTVEKAPLFAEHDNKQLLVKTHFATLRTDTSDVLGIVGKDYEIVQNVDAFSFFDSIVLGEGIQYETAGALGKGERIFITAKLPGYIRVGREDLVDQYLFLTTSHDGFGSITAAFTPVRIVCNNTLNAALRNKSNCIKIRHTANAKDRLMQAHKVLGISNELSVELGNIFNSWAKVRITDKELLKLIQRAMVPNKEVLNKIESARLDEMSTVFVNMCNNVYEYAATSPTQQLETTKGTLFGAYNAITGYFQNVRSYKNEEAKIKSILFGGTGQLRSQAAFDLCQNFARHNFN